MHHSDLDGFVGEPRGRARALKVDRGEGGFRDGHEAVGRWQLDLLILPEKIGGGIPVHAGVSDRNSVSESGGIRCEVLIAEMNVALKHCAHDATLTRLSLGKNATPDIRLFFGILA